MMPRISRAYARMTVLPRDYDDVLKMNIGP